MKKLVAGNWKMNGCLDDIATVKKIADGAYQSKEKTDTVLCVPSVLIQNFVQNTTLPIGGQNCHHLNAGAYTGDISADMLKNVGASYVIVGHSERRIDCYETDKIVHAKANAVFAAQLQPIICVGETHTQYTQGISAQIVIEQIKNSVPQTDKPFAIGYEPIWAIGTGLIPELHEIENIHLVIRGTLQALLGKQPASKVRILYGGSVKPSNASQIAQISNVDGVLVGGASLNSDDFIQIIQAFGI